MTDTMNFNRLKNEKSAYLKQHQNNPIDWFPYGKEAVEKAEKENRPIFLSIGYSTCHWCHVMASESFSDEKVAQFLNKHFICIKVDKEEYPDIDQYYQKACMQFTGRGGWPLSVFTTTDLKPFFVGTYYPLEARNGMPSFMEVIIKINEVFKQQNEKVRQDAESLSKLTKEIPQLKNEVKFNGHFPGPTAILSALDKYFDQENGGYGEAPKFPLFSFYEWATEQMLEALISEEQGKRIVYTIERMLMGGIYDHARGGIHRYSTDKKWLTPHFEKMLYDQTGLLRVLSKLSNVYPSPLFFDGIIQTLDYLETEMRSEKGYFFSAQDADSEGREGLYFTFQEDEFEDAIEEYKPKLFSRIEEIKSWFQITKEGNFESHLNMISLNPKFKEEIYQKENWDIIREVRDALFQARKLRIPPATDNKGVASWNFMTLSALCDVIQYVQIDSIKTHAWNILNESLESIHQTFLNAKDENPEGVLVKSQIQHTNTLENSIPYLEDYVFFAEAQLRIYEVTGNPVFKGNGLKTLEFICNDFIQDGNIYTRSLKYNDSEPYPNIHAPFFDQSYRSPLSTFVSLVRKWKLVMDQDLWTPLKQSIQNLKQQALNNPLGHGEALRALVYPEDAYRKLEVPLVWLREGKFSKFFPFFSQRFAIDYLEKSDERWQICNSKECELSGTNFQEFEKIFQQAASEAKASE